MNNDFDFVNDLKDFKKRINSSKNKAMCEKFRLECRRFEKIAEEYENAELYLCDQFQNRVVKETYSINGRELHRGYYSPSPVFDVVIGNCNRGKLLKRLTKKSNVAFNYGFDESDRLIVVKNFFDESITATEFIIYNNNIATGITFSSDHLITNLCEEIYENRKLKFLSQADFFPENHSIFNLHQESYTYDVSGIKTADIYMYDPQFPLLQHQQYHFKHDADGYLSEYTVTSFDGETPQKSVWDNHIFNVDIKRKV